MIHRPGLVAEALPPEIRRLVVAACERFEEAWRGGARPAIEPYLDGLGPVERTVVLHELIALELSLQAGEGDHPSLEETTDCSSDDAQGVTAAFAPSNGATAAHASARDVPSGPSTEPLATASGDAETMPGMGPERGGGRATLPRRLGRYRVVRLLGRGSSGSVYLARDGELDRDVAIKVPASRSLAPPGRLEAMLAEARLAAGLKHPAIVVVHDVGHDDDGSAFIVLEYVEGTTLSDLLRRGRIEPARLAGLIARIADAVHHAHEAGLIHRDLKPSNIMIDGRGHPRVADFGLAITQASQHDKAGEVAGTPTHMAPEQVRGEAHRLDRRTDVWALGVILYQGLTGRLPFVGRDRAALFEEILRREPAPPRQIDDAVPGELERICLKCLSKRMTDRHGSAADLAEDLRAWLDAARSPDGAGSRAANGRPEVAPRIVPRGLRAFGKEDADSFLDLLPGPRDRDGLPESIRFWKVRLEERDGDATFSVGLLYGPSGCGKSSLVRAGLLPRLAEGVAAICVDASPDQTGARIVRGLRKRLPGIPSGRGLVETFASLRRDDGPKVVIVLDQFEQWLHAHGGEPESELVDALRQCDGGRLQAVLMVRDDFGMAAARFMDALDVPIVQGHNFATLDLFDVDHARHVLTRFGQAFGKLPAGPPGPSAEQVRFLDALTAGLARDGKVVPVRLALFAEMIKGKPWVPSTLEEAGGTEGIGVRFLEETFSSRSANPGHRAHERAARDVLNALLPGVGTDIKGQTRSSAELREASGLSKDPGAFADLLRVLDGELRLITPVDHSESPPGPGDDPSSKWWQLTHDYLVPTLKEWLARKRKETRRGRAELRLEDRAALWSARPEPRHLPSLSEWLGIRALTDAARWTAPQRAMMRRAGRLHGCRLAAACVLVAAFLAGALVVHRHGERKGRLMRANALAGQLLVADIAELPDLVARLERGIAPVVRRLEAVANDPGRPRERRFRASYALAARPGLAATRLIEFARSSDPRELAAIRRRLAPYAPALRDHLWAAADRESSAPASRLRIGTLLAAADEGGDRWRAFARPVANELLVMETLELGAWVDLLLPVAPALKPHLRERFFDATAPPAERVNAALVLARCADSAMFTELLLEADARQFSMLFPAAPRHVEGVVKAAREALSRGEGAPAGDDGLHLRRRARNAAIALLRLGRAGDVEDLLSISADPTVRTMVILEMRDFGTPPERVLAMLGGTEDPTARQALLLALEPYRVREFSPATSRSLSDLLARQIREGRHQADRGAAEWLLRRWGDDPLLDELSRDHRREEPPPAEQLRERDWWITPRGHTMTAVSAPADGGRRLFALGTHEVTMRQYREFRPDADFDRVHHPDDERGPANKVTFVDAMRYCRWLSERERVPEDQMCYPPIGEIVEGDATLPEGRRMRTGYRLPTEDEWELAARAGSTTRWFFGDAEEHLRHFAWCAVNSEDRLHTVGMLRPNPLGLFDILGNTSEWCHPSAATALGLEKGKYVLRGGAYYYPPRGLESTAFYHQSKAGYSYNGFRLARTIATGR